MILSFLSLHNMLPRNPSIIRLLVLSNELLNSLDVLLLGVGGAKVLELSPLVVLRLALCHASQYPPQLSRRL